MGRIVVLFTRDLRVHDNPALAHAVRDAGEVLPLFVFDDNILNSDYARPNRVSFLVQSVEELARSLAALGADLVVRRGDVVAEAMTALRDIGAGAIYMSADVTGYAKARHKRLTAECAAVGCDLKTWPGITVVPPAQVLPAGGDHFRVFTPYFRKWSRARLRAVEAPPGRIASPDGGDTGSIPRPRDLVDGSTSPDMAAGGERAGRAAARSWLDDKLGGYDDGHNDLAADDTSRLSTFLHFGCLSPRELVEEASGRAGGESFVRQLCWRDFYHQVHSATPGFPREDYRPRRDRWRNDPEGLQTWKDGCTGYPIVDAGMRQLAREGWMHNRARLITASFLVKDLYIDWRLGARHFWDLLIDGDMANNSGNWQWVAGTGNDTRPNRVFNPLLQAHRFDHDGTYVRRYVPELAEITGGRVHEPWKLGPERSGIDYPEPMLDHAEAAAEFRRRRA